MTTSNKNFKVKNGLEVLGTSATVDGNEVLTIASSINALSDVDLTGAVAGNSLVFDSALNLIPGEGGGGAAKYYVSDTKPLNPEEGIVWYNSTTGETFIYIVDVDSSQFVEIGTFGPTGATGPQGPAGADGIDGADSTVPGPQGDQGVSGIVAQPEPPTDTTVMWYDTDAPGIGVPLGGTTGQVLSKVDGQDLNFSWSTPYTQSDADSDIASAISNISGAVPADLNTLNKISDAIDADPAFSATVFTAIDAKSDIGHVHAISSVTGLQGALNNKSDYTHAHNDVYYTETEVDALLSEKTDNGHIHDDRYYTETETNSLLDGKANSSHTHAQTDITDLVSDLALKAPLESPDITGDASVENLVINGSLTFNGTATTINSTNTELTDSLIYLSAQQFDTDVVDIGIYGAYGDSNSGHSHTGLVRDASDSKWKLISGGEEPVDNAIDFSGVVFDTLQVGAIEAATANISNLYTSSIVDQLLSALVPAGTVSQTARSTEPTGWLFCQGQNVSRTTYASLFSAIGTTYGTGDGVTTFALPNLQGKVPVGKDSGTFSALGATGGAETVTLTSSQIPAHTHSGTTGGHSADHNHGFSGSTSTNGNHTHGASVGVSGADDNNHTGNGDMVADSDAGYRTQRGVSVSAAGDHSHTFSGTTGGTSGNHTHNFTTDNGTGGGQAHTNLQPYVVLNYMIKI